MALCMVGHSGYAVQTRAQKAKQKEEMMWTKLENAQKQSPKPGVQSSVNPMEEDVEMEEEKQDEERDWEKGRQELLKSMEGWANELEVMKQDMEMASKSELKQDDGFWEKQWEEAYAVWGPEVLQWLQKQKEPMAAQVLQWLEEKKKEEQEVEQVRQWLEKKKESNRRAQEKKTNEMAAYWNHAFKRMKEEHLNLEPKRDDEYWKEQWMQCPQWGMEECLEKKKERLKKVEKWKKEWDGEGLEKAEVEKVYQWLEKKQIEEKKQYMHIEELKREWDEMESAKKVVNQVRQWLEEEKEDMHTDWGDHLKRMEEWMKREPKMGDEYWQEYWKECPQRGMEKWLQMQEGPMVGKVRRWLREKKDYMRMEEDWDDHLTWMEEWMKREPKMGDAYWKEYWMGRARPEMEKWLKERKYMQGEGVKKVRQWLEEEKQDEERDWEKDRQELLKSMEGWAKELEQMACAPDDEDLKKHWVRRYRRGMEADADRSLYKWSKEAYRVPEMLNRLKMQKGPMAAKVMQWLAKEGSKDAQQYLQYRALRDQLRQQATEYQVQQNSLVKQNEELLGMVKTMHRFHPIGGGEQERRNTLDEVHQQVLNADEVKEVQENHHTFLEDLKGQFNYNFVDATGYSFKYYFTYDTDLQNIVQDPWIMRADPRVTQEQRRKTLDEVLQKISDAEGTRKSFVQAKKNYHSSLEVLQENFNDDFKGNAGLRNVVNEVEQKESALMNDEGDILRICDGRIMYLQKVWRDKNHQFEEQSWKKRREDYEKRKPEWEKMDWPCWRRKLMVQECLDAVGITKMQEEWDDASRLIGRMGRNLEEMKKKMLDRIENRHWVHKAWEQEQMDRKWDQEFGLTEQENAGKKRETWVHEFVTMMEKAVQKWRDEQEKEQLEYESRSTKALRQQWAKDLKQWRQEYKQGEQEKVSFQALRQQLKQECEQFEQKLEQCEQFEQKLENFEQFEQKLKQFKKLEKKVNNLKKNNEYWKECWEEAYAVWGPEVEAWLQKRKGPMAAKVLQWLQPENENLVEQERKEIIQEDRQEVINTHTKTEIKPIQDVESTRQKINQDQEPDSSNL